MVFTRRVCARQRFRFPSIRFAADLELLAVVAIGVCFAVDTAVAQKPKPISITAINRTTPVNFEKEILPLLRRSCLACHSAIEAQGGLVLETPRAIRKGGENGPAVIAKNSGKSLLLKLAAHRGDPVMPPPENDVQAKPLLPAELGLLKLWIDQGATGTVSGAISPTGWRPLPRGVNPIYATAVTRDGQYVACGRANQIFLYHVPTGNLVTRLTDPALAARLKDNRPGVAHRDLVQSLAFNAEGDLLASGGFRVVKLWRRPRDVQRLTLPAAPNVPPKVAGAKTGVNVVAASPDGKMLASATTGYGIRLFDLTTGKTGLTMTGHSAPVTSLRFFADGKRMASSSADGTVRVWQVEDGRLVGRIDTSGPVTAITLLAGDTLVASAGTDNLIRLWSVPESLSQPLEKAPVASTVLAVSPDRRFVAAGNAEGSIHVVDIDCGQLVNTTWKAHIGPVTSLSFSGREFQLASAGADKTVKLWDVSTGDHLTTLHTGLTEIKSLSLRLDGKQLATGAADGTITLWNLETPTPKIFTSENKIPATVATISPDGKLLATNGIRYKRPAILIREIASGKLVRTLLGHRAEVTAIAFSADSRRLVTGSADQTACVWDLSDGKFPQVMSFLGHTAALTSVAFSAAGTQVLTGSVDNTAKLWNAVDGKEMKTLVGHTAALVAVAISPDNKTLISASADKTLRFWNPADGKQMRLVTSPAAITSMAISRDGKQIAVAGADRIVRIYNQADGKLLQSLIGHQGPIKSLSFSVDGLRLVTGGEDNVAIVWDASTGRLLEMLPVQKLTVAASGPTANSVLLGTGDAALQLTTMRFTRSLGDMKKVVSRLAYHPNGQTLFSACADGTVRGFTVSNGQQRFNSNHAAAVNDLALSPNGQLLASAGDDKTIKLWNANNGAAAPNPVLGGYTGTVRSVCFSPNGAKVIGGGFVGREVRIFDVTTRTLDQTFVEHAGPVEAIVCAGESGDRVISASTDKTVRTWRLLARRRLTGHSKPVTSLATVPPVATATTLQIISGSEDGTVRHWNMATGQQLRQMNHGGPITAVAVRPDSQRFASAGINKVAKLWNAANGQQLAEMKGDIRFKTRVANLTQETNLATSKLKSAKDAQAAVEKDLPVKTAAAKTAAAALVAAENIVTQRKGVFDKALLAKNAEEKLAVEAAAIANKAVQSRVAADILVLETNAALNMAMRKAARAKAAATAAPGEKEPVAAKALADKAVADLSAKLKTNMTAAATAKKTADNSTTKANLAATKAVATGKPYADSLTTLRQAKSIRDRAAKASTLSADEAKRATDAVPAAKAISAAADARLAKAIANLEAAKKAAAEAEQPLYGVAFSADNRILATGGDARALYTWDAERGSAIESFHGHTAAVQTVLFSPRGDLVSGSTDRSIVVWDPNPGWRLERTIGRIDNPSLLINRVAALDFSADGKLLCTGGGDPSRNGEVKIFRVKDGALVRAVPNAHTDSVFGVAFSPDGTKVASAAADKFVKVFRVADGRLERSFEGHTHHVLGVSWRSDGNVLASAGADNLIKIWNARTGDTIRTIAGFTRQVTAVRFVGESINIVSSSADKTVRLHRTDNGQNFRTFAGGTDFMYSASVTPDGRVVVGGGHDSVLRIWNGTNGQVLKAILPPSTPPKQDAAGSKQAAAGSKR